MSATTKPPRLYVPLDAGYYRDLAIRKAGPMAELLYVRALAFAKSNGTAGFVSRWDLDDVGSGLRSVTKLASTLTEVGLWDETVDGWTIRSWERWNAAEKAMSAGGALGNHQRWHVEKGNPKPGCQFCEEPGTIGGRSGGDSGATRERVGGATPKRREDKNPPLPPIAPSDDARRPEDADPSAQQVVSDWLDTLKRRPPASVIGQVGRNVKTLLGEGFSPAEIGQALTVMGAKGLNPSTLPALVNEVVNRSNVRAIRPARPSGAATGIDGKVKWVKVTERSRWREAYSDEVCTGIYKIKYMPPGELPA